MDVSISLGRHSVESGMQGPAAYRPYFVPSIFKQNVPQQLEAFEGQLD